MTPEYKARREAKHAVQAAVPHSVNMDLETIDLTLRVPRLAWLGGKLFKSGSGGTKNRSGHSQEHTQANQDNRNPYRGEDGLWYWMDETEDTCEIGYVTRDQAEVALHGSVSSYPNGCGRCKDGMTN